MEKAAPSSDEALREKVAQWYLEQSGVNSNLPTLTDGLRTLSPTAIAYEIRDGTEDGRQLMKDLLAGLYGPSPSSDPDPDGGPMADFKQIFIDDGASLDS